MSAKGTILVVEDEALIALSIEGQLKDLGFEVLVASTMADAMAGAQHPDLRLALLDYIIRDQQTTQVAAVLRQRRVPFIICSGSQMDQLDEVFSGAAFVPKPFSEVELEAAVLIAVRAH